MNMNRLFLKIFGWFLLTILLISSALVVVTMTAIPPPPERMWNPGLGSTRFLRQGMMRNLGNMVDLYESGGEAAFTNRKNRAMMMRETFIFDSNGGELPGNPPHSPEVQDLVQRMIGSQKPELYLPPFIGISITSSSRNRYLCVMRADQFNRARGQLSYFNRFRISAYDNLNREMVIGLLAVLLISGILCFFLARHLTTPVSRIRKVTRELTEGRLSARIGGSIGNRNDELGDLAHDFDLMAEKIEQLIQSQMQLIRDVSHELRSPLARLNVALELARISPEESRKPALDRIEQESETLNDMIEQLLNLSRLESGAVNAQEVRFSLGEMLESITEDARYEARNRKIGIDLIRKDEFDFTGYQQVLHSALENVVRNALAYSREESSVTVILGSGELNGSRCAEIRIADRGEGVPERELEKIFAPFYRLAPSRDRSSGGTGIGLAITERAVRLHGGTINAANRPEGGLIITIRLPLK